MRGGSFIPLGKAIQSTKQYDVDEFQLHYYFDSSVTKSKREFYNDNGVELEALNTELYEIIAKHTKQPYKKIWADSDRDYWMTAKEAKDYGMIDEVLVKHEK